MTNGSGRDKRGGKKTAEDTASVSSLVVYSLETHHCSTMEKMTLHWGKTLETCQEALRLKTRNWTFMSFCPKNKEAGSSWRRRVQRETFQVQISARSLHTCTYAITHTALNRFFFLWQLHEARGRVPARRGDSRLSSRDLSARSASPGWREAGWQAGPAQGRGRATGAFWEETAVFALFFVVSA